MTVMCSATHAWNGRLRTTKNVAVSPVKQQLKAKVADSLASRGIKANKEDMWQSKPSSELSKDERRRLDKQRENKRRWAQKERKRARKELEDLQTKNGTLTYTNTSLRKDVEKLKRLKFRCECALFEHKCRLGTASRVSRREPSKIYVHQDLTICKQKCTNFPLHSDRNGDKALKNDVMLSTISTPKAFTTSIPLGSDGEEELDATGIPPSEKYLMPSLIPLKKSTTISNGNINDAIFIWNRSWPVQKSNVLMPSDQVGVSEDTENSEACGAMISPLVSDSSSQQSSDDVMMVEYALSGNNVIQIDDDSNLMNNEVESNEPEPNLSSQGFVPDELTMEVDTEGRAKSFTQMLKEADEDVQIYTEDYSETSDILHITKRNGTYLMNEEAVKKKFQSKEKGYDYTKNDISKLSTHCVDDTQLHSVTVKTEPLDEYTYNEHTVEQDSTANADITTSKDVSETISGLQSEASKGQGFIVQDVSISEAARPKLSSKSYPLCAWFVDSVPPSSKSNNNILKQLTQSPQNGLNNPINKEVYIPFANQQRNLPANSTEIEKAELVDQECTRNTIFSPEIKQEESEDENISSAPVLLSAGADMGFEWSRDRDYPSSAPAVFSQTFEHFFIMEKPDPIPAGKMGLAPDTSQNNSFHYCPAEHDFIATESDAVQSVS